MKRIITFISFGIFIISIVVFAGFGKQIRDFCSPHVDVTPITGGGPSNYPSCPY